MSDGTCAGCGAPARTKWCGEACRVRHFRARRTEAQRTRASQYARERARGLTGLPTAPCAACGQDTGKVARSDARVVCSTTCRAFLRYGVWPQSKVPKSHPSRRKVKPPKLKSDYVQPTFSACVICAVPFSSAQDRSTCSEECAITKRRRAARERKARHMARKRGAYVATVVPTLVFERDGYRCQLCGRPTKRAAVVPHPLAPTVDHIIPLAAGGTHEPANVQTAHFLCNSTKRDHGGGQLRLIG